MAAALLEGAGYEVQLLGGDVPVESLAEIAVRHRPAIVALSVTMPDSAALLDSTIHHLREVRQDAGIIVGGSGVPARLRDMPGLSVCRLAADAVETVDALLQRAALN
jgi:methanogenic corrinoid protein MtbC1